MCVCFSFGLIGRARESFGLLAQYIGANEKIKHKQNTQHTHSVTEHGIYGAAAVHWRNSNSIKTFFFPLFVFVAAFFLYIRIACTAANNTGRLPCVVCVWFHSLVRQRFACTHSCSLKWYQLNRYHGELIQIDTKPQRKNANISTLCAMRSTGHQRSISDQRWDRKLALCNLNRKSLREWRTHTLEWIGNVWRVCWWFGAWIAKLMDEVKLTWRKWMCVFRHTNDHI